MVVMGVMGILASMMLPAVVNSRRMVERRLTYVQYREYVMAVASGFQETTHLDQPLMVALDFTYSSVVYKDIAKYYNELIESKFMDGKPMPEMRYFKALDFTGTDFDDRWMKAIIKTPCLEKLVLDNTKITDRGLLYIMGFHEQETGDDLTLPDASVMARWKIRDWMDHKLESQNGFSICQQSGTIPADKSYGCTPFCSASWHRAPALNQTEEEAKQHLVTYLVGGDRAWPTGWNLQQDWAWSGSLLPGAVGEKLTELNRTSCAMLREYKKDGEGNIMTTTNGIKLRMKTGPRSVNIPWGDKGVNDYGTPFLYTNNCEYYMNAGILDMAPLPSGETPGPKVHYLEFANESFKFHPKFTLKELSIVNCPRVSPNFLKYLAEFLTDKDCYRHGYTTIATDLKKKIERGNWPTPGANETPDQDFCNCLIVYSKPNERGSISVLASDSGITYDGENASGGDTDASGLNDNLMGNPDGSDADDGRDQSNPDNNDGGSIDFNRQP